MFIIEATRFNELKAIAKKEAARFKRRKNHSATCANTLQSCLVGIMAEEAAAMFVVEQGGKELERITQLGIQQRMEPKKKVSGDIAGSRNGKMFRFDVRGIRKGQVKGQIARLPYSSVGMRIDNVIFVEVELLDDSAVCDVYLVASPSDITTWEKINNSYGKGCFTHPDYAQQAFLRANNY